MSNSKHLKYGIGIVVVFIFIALSGVGLMSVTSMQGPVKYTGFVGILLMAVIAWCSLDWMESKWEGEEQ